MEQVKPQNTKDQEGKNHKGIPREMAKRNELDRQLTYQ